jgi:predicted transcriptional regulator
MSKVSIQLPDALHRQLRECASTEKTSIHQLINSAVAEKLAALLGPEYLEARAKRASRKSFMAALKKIPDVEPPQFDRLPDKAHERTVAEYGKRRKKKKQSDGGR